MNSAKSHGDLASYSTLVFDCDGVILDSNAVKSEAFYAAALPYGEQAATAFVEYHKRTGGVSRYEKFKTFLRDMVPAGATGPGLEELLAAFAREVQQRIMTCRIAEGLAELRKQTAGATWMVVSGGDQAELRHVFRARGLEKFFDGGIFGSPDKKEAIIAREKASGTLRLPGLFIGDSRYDHEAARSGGLDFLFVSGWTEFSGWREYCGGKDISVVGGVGDLVEKG